MYPNKYIRQVIQVAIVFSLFIACEQAPTFDKPQPDNTNALNSFPKRIQGEYLSTDQASTVTIGPTLMIRTYDFDFKDNKNSLDSFYKLKGDSLIDKRDSSIFKIRQKGDSIYSHMYWSDTLFNISNVNILKKYKGYYFLNIRYADNAWEVQELSLKNGVLTIRSLSESNDIQKLEELSEAASDTLPLNFTLTRKQFKNFIKQDGFSVKETFSKIATHLK